MIKSAYLTGARPVVGTLGACGLMLLACSWFVLAPGDMGTTRDIGAPAPAWADGATSDRTPAHHPLTRAMRARASRPRAVKAEHNPAALTSLPPRRTRTPEPIAASAPPPATAPAVQFPVAAPSPTPTPATEPAAVMPTASAPVGDLPQVTLPAFSIPSVPAVSVPDLGTTISPPGLP